ncbi:MAG: (2Fe-2S)-binding protein [Leptospiraceae bacterium]|nr:(2Fe-2S)-binding protein [Leptospiraceae bacterium]
MDLSCLMRPRKICLCKCVSRADVTEAVAGGADTFRKLIEKTHATTGCGTCYQEMYAAFREEKEKAACQLTGQIGLKF